MLGCQINQPLEVFALISQSNVHEVGPWLLETTSQFRHCPILSGGSAAVESWWMGLDLSMRIGCFCHALFCAFRSSCLGSLCAAVSSVQFCRLASSSSLIQIAAFGHKVIERRSGYINAPLRFAPPAQMMSGRASWGELSLPPSLSSYVRSLQVATGNHCINTCIALVGEDYILLIFSEANTPSGNVLDMCAMPLVSTRYSFQVHFAVAICTAYLPFFL